jgi:hypothetical protein
MAASWHFRGAILVVVENGVTSNDELEQAFVREALAEPRAKPGQAVLWDSRLSVTPITAEDVEWRSRMLWELAERGRIARLALLLAPRQNMTAATLRQRRIAIPGLRFEVFADEADAVAWLVASD